MSGKFVIINVYAPIGEEARYCVHLWKEIFLEFDNQIPWLLMGDFNMIEELSNQSGGNPNSIKGHEKRA